MRRETFKTPDRVLLNLRVPAGSIEIDAVEGLAETKVSLEVRGGDRDILERCVIEAREVEAHHEILVQVPETRLLRFIQIGAPHVDVAVQCPAGTDLMIHVVSTEVRAKGRFGKAEVNGVSGDVALDQVGGDASIKTVSGDAKVTEVAGRATGQTVSGRLIADHIGGAAEMRTISGDFRLGRLDGPVTAQSISGDIELGSVVQGEVTLKTVSGDIQVGIRRGTRVWVDARSIGGRTSSELPVSDEEPEGKGPLVELRATATSGEIRLHRARGREASADSEFVSGLDSVNRFRSHHTESIRGSRDAAIWHATMGGRAGR